MSDLKFEGIDPDVIERAMQKQNCVPQLSKTDAELIDQFRARSQKANTGVAFKRQNVCNSASYMPIKKIPSMYRLDYQDIFEVRTMLVPEVKHLADISDENSSYVMNDILSKCCNYPIDEIYIGDRLFLILWIRYNTFPNAKYKVPFTCPVCGESTFHFKFENISVNYLKDEYDPNLELVTNKGDVIKLAQLKVKHEKEIDRFKAKKEIRDNYTEKELDVEMLGLASMITEINGQTTQIEREDSNGNSYVVTNLMKTFPYLVDGNNIDPDDFVMLVSYVQDNKIGVEPIMHITCEKCAGEFPMGFTFSPQFFIPKCPVRTNTANRA